MRVLVIGANGGSGKAVVQQLLARGHHVTAFSRNGRGEPAERLTHLRGDATELRDVERAVAGHDAVVITLGIRENPLRVRLLGASRTLDTVRSVGTRNVMVAMREYGVRKLVVQTSYGVGDTRGRLRFVDALLFKLLLAPQIADTEVQNREVSESGLDWVIAQPVHLTDDPSEAVPFLSTEGATGALAVSRTSVGRFLAQAVEDARFVGKTVSVSGAVPG